MSKLAGKVAVVTGASKGIGAAIASAFAAEGAMVVVNYSSDEAGASRIVGDIQAGGGKAFAVQANVSEQADVTRLFKSVMATFGKIDILVNNAAVAKMEPLEAVTEAEFHRMFNTNVLGSLLTMQAAAKHFSAEGGAIINIGSVVSQNPTPNRLVYAASKAALDAMTVALSRELGPRQIRVNTIAPGPTATEGLKALGTLDSEVGKHMLKLTPLGRFGEPSDVARVAVFLASDDAAWLTGERISASGGWR